MTLLRGQGGDFTMPKIGGKKYPYTKKGKKAAKKAGKKMMMKEAEMKRMMKRKGMKK